MEGDGTTVGLQKGQLFDWVYDKVLPEVFMYLCKLRIEIGGSLTHWFYMFWGDPARFSGPVCINNYRHSKANLQQKMRKMLDYLGPSHHDISLPILTF